MASRTATVALLLLLPAISWAQVYKWVDENGVVNYGDKPPARYKSAQPLADDGGGVSVVPGMPKEEMERLRAESMRRRVQQLEREVDELRVRASARDSPQSYSAPSEVYVPAYGYAPDYGYRYGYGYPRRPLNPGFGRGPHPEHPIANTGRGRSSRPVPTEPMPGAAPVRRGRG